MTSENDPKQDRIDRYIDQNLKKVFADLEKDSGVGHDEKPCKPRPCQTDRDVAAG